MVVFNKDSANSPNVVQLTSGNDTLDGVPNGSTIVGNASTLNVGDRLVGGGNDILSLSGAGTFDLTSLAAFSGFGTVRAIGGNYILTLPNQVLSIDTSNATGPGTLNLGPGLSTVSLGSGGNTVNFGSGGATVTGGGAAGNFGAAFDLNFSSGSVAASLNNSDNGSQYNFGTGSVKLAITNATYNSFNFGAGSANVALQGALYGTENVQLSTGLVVFDASQATGDRIFVTAASSTDIHAGDVLNGPSGTASNFPNTLALMQSVGVYDLSQITLNGIQNLQLSGAVVDGDNNLSGFSAITGTGEIDFSGSNSDLSNTGVSSNIKIVSNNVNGTSFIVKDIQSALDIIGSSGNDTISTQAFTFTAAQRETIFEQSPVKSITDPSGTYMTPSLVRLTSGNDTLDGVPNGSTIVGNASTLNVGDRLVGGGNDILSLSGAGTFDLTSLAAFSGFGTVRAIGGNYILTLPNQVLSIDTSNATGPGTLNLGPGLSTVSLGSGGNTVNFGSGGATVTGGGAAGNFGAAFDLNFSSGSVAASLNNSDNGSQYNFGTGSVKLAITNATYNSFNFGAGSANVALQGALYGTENVQLSTGLVVFDASQATGDRIFVTAASSTDIHAGDVLNGPSGTASNFPNTLALMQSVGVYDLSQITLNGIQNLQLSGAVVDGDNNLSGFSAITGTGEIDFSGSNSDLSNTGVSSNIKIVSNNVNGTSFIVKDIQSALDIIGSSGNDTISTQAFTFTAAQRETIFEQSPVKSITDPSGTYMTPSLVRLTSGNDTLDGVPNGSTIVGNASTLNVGDRLVGGWQ